MTASANRLTAGATVRAAASSNVETMPASDVRALADALARLGYDVEALLAADGRRRPDLDDPDGRVPCEAYGALVSRAQRERFIPNLALRLALETPIGAFPLLDYLVVTSDRVGDGIRQLARYFRLVESPVGLEVREEADPIELRMTAPAEGFSAEFSASLIVLHLREETNGLFAPARVSFSHHPDDPGELGRVLGCPIEPGASWNGLRITKEAWALPLRRRDSVLRGVLERQADGAIARIRPGGMVADDVRRVLASRLARGDTRIAGTARQLATSPRTLQRRLAAEGLSHQELLDATRREAAQRQLEDSTLSINELSYLLGYSEPAAFHRAFRRWFGVTPQAFRRGSRP